LSNALFNGARDLSEDSAEILVNKVLPKSIHPIIPSALRRAYAAADKLIDEIPFLATPGGLYQRGDLIMVAASYEFELLVKGGNLPFEGRWEFFARPTGKHFVMYSDSARVTIGQVEDPSKKPRRARHRENYSGLNEILLFPEMNVEREKLIREAEQAGARSLLHILHGYRDLAFVHVAYPHPERNEHIYLGPNLLRLPHELSGDPGLLPPEGPSDSPKPEVIDNIRRFIRDQE
jgi:hypothetical protein